MPLKSALIFFALLALAWASFCNAQMVQQPAGPIGPKLAAEEAAPGPGDQPSAGTPGQPTGIISGTVVDQSGAVVAGARVRLTVPGSSQAQETLSGADGQFAFAKIDPGPFQLTVTSAGFAPQTSSGILHPGETSLPKIALTVATKTSEIEVTMTRTELAEKEIKVEEKQRVLGVVPNFYVSYVPDAVPLDKKQKFEIAWKTVIDPVTFVMAGAAAGVEQAQNHFAGYGQGAEGYGQRFGAGYADIVTGTFIGGAILPSLLKQDPRYFYKGTGSKRSRLMYAIASSFICKGDNGRWQPNYSNVLGSLAAGGISNLYYPEQDRDGLGLTFENAAIGLGATSIQNILQEFFIRKFTPKAPKNDPSKP
jgi:Carboxypeptidase regulatory-like domain